MHTDCVLMHLVFAVADWKATSTKDNWFAPDQVLQFMERVLDWMEEPEQHWILDIRLYVVLIHLFDINNLFGTSFAYLI